MDAKVIWRGGLSFNGTANTGFLVPVGADASVGGANDGSRPMELLAIGLAGCTAMDVISILQKKRQEITDFEVQTHLERRESHPRVFTQAVIEYLVTGHNVDETAVVRAIELSATTYCSAQAMFSKLMPIEIKYHIYEDLGDGQRDLITSGIYTQAEQVAS